MARGWIESRVEKSGKKAYRAAIRVDNKKVVGSWAPTRDLARAQLGDLQARAFAQKSGVKTGASPKIADLVEQMRRRWTMALDRERSPTTVRGYLHHALELERKFGAVRVAKLRPSDVENWIQEMRDAKLSTSSIRARLDRLHEVLRLAEEGGWLRAWSPNRPKNRRSRAVESITENEFQKLVEAAQAHSDPRALIVILLAGDAGLRRREIQELVGRQVTLKPWGNALGVIRLDQTKSYPREIPILTQRLHDALAASLTGPDDPIAGVNATLCWTLALEVYGAAKVKRPSMALHVLRARFCTALLAAGVDPLTIMKWSGHRDLSTLQGYARDRRASDSVPPAARSIEGAGTKLHTAAASGLDADG